MEGPLDNLSFRPHSTSDAPIASTCTRSGGRAVADDATEAPGLSAGFYGSRLQIVVRELELETRVHLLRGGGLVLLGVLLIVVPQFTTLVTDKVQSTLLTVAGGFLASITAVPVNVILALRRKTAILDGYQRELTRIPPPAEAVDAVKDFLSAQLKEAGK